MTIKNIINENNILKETYWGGAERKKKMEIAHSGKI